MATDEAAAAPSSDTSARSAHACSARSVTCATRGVRVLTINIFAHHRGWPERRRVLAEGLAALDPDVVVLQEAIGSDADDQVVDLLGGAYEVFHQGGREKDGSGLSVASRWPMTIILDTAVPIGDDRRGVRAGRLGVAEIAAPSPLGRVLLGHHSASFQSGAERDREAQAVSSARIVEYLLAREERHVVLAGDFNATPEAASIRFWTGRQSLDGISLQYQDAWEAIHGDAPGHTFTPENGIRSDRWRPHPGRRIDYIMVRCGDRGSTLDITACERVFDEPVDGIWASDHFGVMADLEPAPASDQP